MIREIIGDYLEKSTLTQAVLADRLGVSSRYFADVKNGKKPPSLKLGLKAIAEFENGNIQLKQKWINLHASQAGNTEVLKFLKEKEMTKELNKLSNEISLKLANDVTCLYNAFCDILESKDKGITKGFLIENYGLSILKKLRLLVEKDFVKEENNKFFVKNSEYLMHSRESTFRMIISLVKHEQNLWESGENEGFIRWNSWEIENEKYKDYLDLLRRQHKEQVEFLEKHEKPTNEGGVRVGSYIGLTLLKRMFLSILLVVFVLIGNLDLIANGQGGGIDPGGGGPKLMTTINSDGSLTPFKDSSTNLEEDKEDDDLNVFWLVLWKKLLNTMFI